MKINLVRISDAYPERYDAFDEHGILRGYMRLRCGHFRVECLDIGGKLVYESKTSGDGCFDSDEREKFLHAAIQAIKEYWGVSVDEKKKETPMKVLYNVKRGALCPSCDQELDFMIYQKRLFRARLIRIIRWKTKRCHNCGQVLDWGD